ncbi:Ig-like domain-containing protein, partial [Mycobacterium sp. 852014-52144_SCH5372336]|uniref:Ig-like domain-containing protein n=1 Tax=Mycobacterium sp. 852014-52144_SCH5372336 TaxID=1834115 RepID=UPI000A683F60
DPALTKDSFTISVQDGVGGNSTVTVEVDILEKNAKPTGRAKVTKPDTTTGVVTVTITATDGDRDTISFSAPATSSKGGTVTTIGTGVFSYSPTEVARYNASLPTASAADKVDTFTVTLDDGHGGVVNQLVSVTISPKSRPNNVATSGGATAYTEQQGPVVVDAALTLNNSASSSFSGATVTVNTPQTGDSLAFTAPAGSGITGSYNAGTGILTLTGTSSVANYQAALRSVTFTSTTDAPTATKTVSFMVIDASQPSALATKTIAISAVNDVPAVVTSGGSTAYTEQQIAVVVDGTLTISDPDSASLTKAIVTLTSPQTGDTLAFTTPVGSGINGSYNAASGVLTLTGTSSVANYQAALRSVTFTSTTDAPTATKTVSFVVTDAGASSAAATKTIAITAVNDAPALNGGGGNVVAAPGIPVKIAPAVSVADSDSGNLTGATVAITVGRQTGDVLALSSPQSGITPSYNPSTGALTLTGTASVANYQAALRSVTFANNSVPPSGATRTIAITVTDGALTSNTITQTATVRVNHAPVANSNAFTGAEDTLVSGNVLANDTDANGDTLTASLGSGASNGIVNLNSNGSFTYAPYVNFHGTDSFTYTASDGFTTSNTATVTLTVTAVDDVVFQFTYGEGSEYWTPQAKAALQAAADRLSEYFATPSPVTMTYDVTGYFDPDSWTLATGGIAGGIPLGGYQNPFIRKVTSVNHYDADPAAADGQINWNFGKTYSYDDTPAEYEFDFQSVAMHELLHSFGYQSFTTASDLTSRTTWLTYDNFLVDQSGTKVIGEDFKFKSAYVSNLSGLNGGLYFGGANAVAAYGGLVPLEGDSVAHLRSTTFPYNSASRKIMGPISAPGVALRTISPFERGILMDLGYTVAGGTQTIALGFAAAEEELHSLDTQSGLSDSDAIVAAIGAGQSIKPAAMVTVIVADSGLRDGQHDAYLVWLFLFSPFSVN